MERHQALKAEILGKSYELQGIMGLGLMDIRHVFDEQTENDLHAEVLVQWEYHNAEVTWFLKDHEDMDVYATAAHELAHCLLAPIADFVPKHSEKLSEWVTEAVAKSIIRARRK
jgi:hypothetical protein